MCTTKSRFEISCGGKFNQFANNFNIEKEKFVLPFMIHKNDMLIYCGFLKVLQVIVQLKDNRNIVDIVLVKNCFEFLWRTV